MSFRSSNKRSNEATFGGEAVDGGDDGEMDFGAAAAAVAPSGRGGQRAPAAGPDPMGGLDMQSAAVSSILNILDDDDDDDDIQAPQPDIGNAGAALRPIPSIGAWGPGVPSSPGSLDPKMMQAFRAPGAGPFARGPPPPGFMGRGRAPPGGPRITGRGRPPVQRSPPPQLRRPPMAWGRGAPPIGRGMPPAGPRFPARGPARPQFGRGSAAAPQSKQTTGATMGGGIQQISRSMSTPSTANRPITVQQPTRSKSASTTSSRYIPLPRTQFKSMTKFEIASVLRMQLAQLRASNPQTEDFYFQVHEGRKGRAVRPGGNLEPFKFLKNQPRNKDGTPVLSTGTLGRIQASNLRRPKRLLELAGNDDGDGEPAPQQDGKNEADRPARKFMFGRLSLSYLIEDGVSCLVKIEDIDSTLNSLCDPLRVPPPNHPSFPAHRLRVNECKAQREKITRRLCAALDLDTNPAPSVKHLVMKFAQKRKGRLLVFRSLRLLPPREAGQLAAVVLHNLRTDAPSGGSFATPLGPNASGDAALLDSRISDAVSESLMPVPLGRINHIFLSMAKQARAAVARAARGKGAGAGTLLSSRLSCCTLQAIMKRAHITRAQAEQFNAQRRAYPGMVPPKPVADAHAQTETALQHWRQIFDVIAALFVGRIAKLFWRRDAEGVPQGQPKGEAKQKEGKAKDASNASSWASEDDIWELLAAVTSHATPEQRAKLKNEIASELQKRQVEGTKNRGRQYLMQVYLGVQPRPQPPAQQQQRPRQAPRS